MSIPSFAMATVSYAPDFERCTLLARSVKEFVDPSIRHYITVDRRDMPLFRQLEGPRTEILAVESILPWWVFRVPMAQRWWFSLKTKPVRNWILQQVVKLAMPQHVDADVMLHVDSDVTFVQPFSGQLFLREDNVRLFRVPGEGSQDFQRPWHLTASRLLGLPACDYFGARYIGNIISWRRDNVLRLHQHIEQVTGRHWIEAVISQWQLSEYILYGVFCDQILANASGHYNESDNACLEYWDNRPLSDVDLKKFFEKLQPEHIAVMLSAKAGMDVAQYEQLVGLEV